MALVTKILVASLPVGMSLRAGQSTQHKNTPLIEMISIDEQVKVLEDLQQVGQQFTTELAVNGSRDRADGYDASAEFIMAHIKSISPALNPVLDLYDDTMWRNSASPGISIGDKAFSWGPDFGIMTYSGSGVVEGVPSAPSGNPNGCSPEDWEGFPAGNTALVARGACSFCNKVFNAQQAGAGAFVLYFLEGQNMFVPRLTCDWGKPNFPALSATYEVGQAISGVSVRVEASGENIQKKSSNVILDFPGGDPNFVVVLGAHLDSVPDTPGINDNGSGSALIMEILRTAVIKYLDGGMKNGLRFCWFGSEEWGLIGSRKYVGKLSSEEKLKIAGMLNFDMMASPNGGNFINKGSMDPMTPTASGYIQRQFELGFEYQGAPWQWSGLGGSDYVSFLEAGIPAGGINAGASSRKTQEMAAKFGGVAGQPYAPCYHKACDTKSNYDPERLFTTTKATAFAVEKMVLDPSLRVHLAREGVESVPATDEDVVDAEHKDDEAPPSS